MSWLIEYQDDLLALEEARSEIFPINFNNEEHLKVFFDDLKTIFAPLEDGSLDPSDVDSIVELFWKKFGISIMQAAKKEAAIQRRLVPLYRRLESASENEWEEYWKMIFRIHFRSPLMQWLLDSEARSNAAFSEAQESIEKLKKLLGE